MKKYNLINNSLGWLCFIIAAVTYLLTIEPTASFWDCPEFIAQGYKLEVGHPPGNPIFILAARFFINFAGSDPSNVAVAVNVMSALLSAATILLLFWTITHLMRRLIVDSKDEVVSTAKMIVIMAAGVVGALAYTWSDTFWYSAVEGEVYAFSSFCTALVVWLILKWENRADLPHSDRYLILVAYVIGISIAVHLLNLLTIPALALVVYFRKTKKEITLKSTLMVLLLSFVIIALILFGLVPGFIENAQYFELFFVNTLGMSYNSGVLVYALILVGVLIWCINALYRQNSTTEIRISFILSVLLSGIPFIGNSWVLPVAIMIALIVYMFKAKALSVRLLTICALSILVMFVGYSSYAVLLIRSHANPPMNQNAPDNVFALSSYLNREQYGETPLLFGPSFASTIEMTVDGNDVEYRSSEGKTEYGKVVKTSPDQPDEYVKLEPKLKYKMTPTMFFPRMYSTQEGHAEGYLSWIGETKESLPTKDVTIYFEKDGKPFKVNGQEYTERVARPSFVHNLRYFITYQLNYMYWRYFMWNFAGRQNDIQGQGEVNRGNWISGIPFIDNARLGDQSLLPKEYGEGNKGHNVFYMLPLLLGLLGIVAQMMRGMEGVKQFWVVFLLFFMTGIAIVLYINQPPNQPRERDYAFAGSFYAFAIWIGLGVYMVWQLILQFIAKAKRNDGKMQTIAAAVAAVVALIVPLQMVSQTWDDHDRSGRYTTRDFGMNYLSSLDQNAIIFTNGDNDTFPLWYAQEVEGYRTDVRVVNLAYLTTDWYVNHAKMPANDAAAIEFQAQPADYAYDRLQYNFIAPDTSVSVPVDVFSSLNDLYTSPAADDPRGIRVMRYPKMYIPVNPDSALARGVITPDLADRAKDHITVDLSGRRAITLSEAVSLDMIAHGAIDGWNRPTYFAMTVPNSYYLNLEKNLRNTGLAYQVTPVEEEMGVSTDKMYDNVMNKFRWGGLDQVGNGEIYLDETVRRMVTTHRSTLVDLITALYNEGVSALYYSTGDSTGVVANENMREYANDRFRRAADVLKLLDEKLPVKHSPYSIQIGQRIADLYVAVGSEMNDAELVNKGLDVYMHEICRYAEYVNYFSSLIDDENRRRQRRSRFNAKPASLRSLSLTTIDLYAPYYLYSLIQSYSDAGGDIELLQKTLDTYGTDLLAKLEAMLPSNTK